MIHGCFNFRLSLLYHSHDPELYFSGLILGIYFYISDFMQIT